MKGVIIVYLVRGKNAKDAVYFDKCSIAEAEAVFRQQFPEYTVIKAFTVFKPFACFHLSRYRREQW